MYNNFLSEFLTSSTRSEILRILFDGLQRERYLREIEKLTYLKINSIQKEVKHLEGLDLIRTRKDGNRIYYFANIDHPIYSELVSIVKKTVGILSELQSLFEDSRIKCSFVFGSFAKNKENAYSDLDIVIIGNIGMRALSKILSSFQSNIGREVNPHIFTPDEWVKRVKENDHFVSSILESEVDIIKGNLDEFRDVVLQYLQE